MNDDQPISPAKAYYLSGFGHCNVVHVTFLALERGGAPRNDSTWIALQNVIGVALETSLKAFLAASGIAESELSSRRYGHNLRNLLDSCIECGIEAEAQHERQPELLDALDRLATLIGPDYHSHNFRYLNRAKANYVNQRLAVETTIMAIRCVLLIAKRRGGFVA